MFCRFTRTNCCCACTRLSSKTGARLNVFTFHDSVKIIWVKITTKLTHVLIERKRNKHKHTTAMPTYVLHVNLLINLVNVVSMEEVDCIILDVVQ